MSVAAQSDVLSDSPPWHIHVPLTNIPARTTQGASLFSFFMGALEKVRRKSGTPLAIAGENVAASTSPGEAGILPSSSRTGTRALHLSPSGRASNEA